jgi:hypothetical protein
VYVPYESTKPAAGIYASGWVACHKAKRRSTFVWCNQLEEILG